MAPEFYRLNSSGGSLPTHMQGTKSDLPGVYTSTLSNGNPSPNLTTPALFPDAGDVTNFLNTNIIFDEKNTLSDGAPIVCGGQFQWLAGGLPGFNNCSKYDALNDAWTVIGSTLEYG